MKNNKHILVLGVVLILTAFAFLPCLKNGFVNWDDDTHLTVNEQVRFLTLPGVKNIFSQLVNGTYIPLTVLSYAIEYHFFELKPFIYHFTNLILHLTVVGLVYVLAVSMGLPSLAAGTAALIFGLHPVHVESVAWVTGRKDVLYSAFYLLSVIFYLMYLKRNNLPVYLFSVGCGILAILAKPMALSLPLVLWIMDWSQEREINGKLVWDKILYFLFLVPVAWITYINNTDVLEPSKDAGRTAVLYIWNFTFYIWKFFCPVGFSPVREISEPISLTHLPYSLGLLLFGAMMALLFLLRRDRMFIFAVIFYFASIFFLLRVDVAVFSEQTVSDRFMYLPSVGFCLWLGTRFSWVNERAKKGKRVFRLALMVLMASGFLGLGAASFWQCRIWKDGGTLWRQALKYYPQSAVANNNLADFLLKRGEVNQEVIGYCRRAIKANPLYANAYVNLGSALAQLGDVDEAAGHFRKALSLRPQHAVAHANLATALSQQGKREEAVIHARKAIELGFHQPDIYRILKQSP